MELISYKEGHEDSTSTAIETLFTFIREKLKTEKDLPEFEKAFILIYLRLSQQIRMLSSGVHMPTFSVSRSREEGCLTLVSYLKPIEGWVEENKIGDRLLATSIEFETVFVGFAVWNGVEEEFKCFKRYSCAMDPKVMLSEFSEWLINGTVPDEQRTLN